MVRRPGLFAWYELMTTDVAAARAFYAGVVGWGAKDASTSDLVYTLFTAGNVPASGLMELPEEARRMGATPRWMGYVGVDDVDVASDRIKCAGGAVYVPPTDSNIGRISVVADPQTATFALVQGFEFAPPQPAELDAPGRVGWHELLAADWTKAFAFYAGLFGWQKAEAESGPVDAYQLFSAAGKTIGGMFTKRPVEPIPYWLYYFNVDDIDAAAERVKRGGGQVFEGPFVVPEGSWIARCVDPQGAIFALQGKRSRDAIAKDPASEVGWSTEWSGISSRGRLTTKPKG
ncbi:VOC family protein [Bradyrhizobium sp.]|uniref:VOC family protein n=1 Tax=Bradyrhizobium sp. TaxID=376 RepID=UPI0025B84630|nr:VOC family protein [Bradyrhizobium sp.]